MQPNLTYKILGAFVGSLLLSFLNPLMVMENHEEEGHLPSLSKAMQDEKENPRELWAKKLREFKIKTTRKVAYMSAEFLLLNSLILTPKTDADIAYLRWFSPLNLDTVSGDLKIKLIHMF